MNKNIKPKKQKMRRWVRNVLITECIILPIIFIFIIFNNQINTILSIKKISNAPAYEITYNGDYKFDKYLESGISSDTASNSFIKKNVLYGIGKINFKNHGCSGFYAKTPDGDLIFARNYDAQGGIASILKTASSYKSVSIADLSCCGWRKTSNLSLSEKYLSLASPYLITDGMNENGVAAAVFTLKDPKTGADRNVTSINDLAVLRLILDKSKNVNEAIDLVKQYTANSNSNIQSHYMIADAEGNSAVIEYVDGKIKVTYKNGNFQIISNFILYGNDNPTLVGDGADARYWNYNSALSKTNGVISTEDALKLLKENTVKGREQWSVVYNLTKRTMSVTFYGDYENVYNYGVDTIFTK